VGAGGKKPKKRRRLAPAQIEAILRNPDVVLSWPEEDQRSAANVLAWSARETLAERKRLSRLRGELYGRPDPLLDLPGGLRGGVCCSHRWADDCWIDNVPYPGGHRHPRAVGEGGAAAKGRNDECRISNDETGGMRRCPLCKAAMPAIYLGSSGHCEDCKWETMRIEQSSRVQRSGSVIFFRRN
jgi:hypothetical protein